MKILIVTLFFVANVNAGLLIEPFAGMVISGTSENNDKDCSENCEDTVSGTSFGLRAGYKFLGVFGGIDYRNYSQEIEDTELDIEEGGRVGLLVGYEFPVLLRLWLSYGLSNDLSAENRNGVDLDYTTSRDIIFGAGYSLLPFLSLNLEYTMLNLEEVSYEEGDFDVDTDISTVLVSLSVPFSI
tara:strand:+ start:2785 stop:3336 length:552 start_codon:yes stop_codon:yes gene_type:complete